MGHCPLTAEEIGALVTAGVALLGAVTAYIKAHAAQRAAGQISAPKVTPSGVDSVSKEGSSG